MIKTINKIDLCVDMIIASARSLKQGSDIDYVSSILLSGAVNEILEPLFEELNIKTKRGNHAELTAHIAKRISNKAIDAERVKKSAFRNSKFIYNTLKHAGDKKDGKFTVAPSSDLEIDVNLMDEAKRSLGFAIDNFLALPPPYVTQEKINHVYPKEFLDISQTLRYEIG